MKKLLTTLVISLVILFAFTLAVSAEDSSACEHTYETYKITEKPIPTCMENTRPGTAIYTCSRCGETKTEYFNYEHHYHSEVTTPATCDTKGLMTHTCEHCKKTYTEELDYAHTYHEEITTAPTCTENGAMTKTCSKCGDTQEVVLSPEHTKANLVLLMVPSCFAEGQVRYTCSVCSQTITEAIAKAHDYESTVTKQPTCTEDGLIRRTCLHCNASRVDVILASHDYGYTAEHIVKIVYSDFTKTGIKYYGCKKCNAVGENAEGIIANPLVIFLGYSIPGTDDFVAETGENCVEIACTYTIDTDALQEYLDVMGADSLEYGLVGAYESHLLQDGVQSPPLNSETGVTNDHITQAVTNNSTAVVKKIKFLQNTYESVSARLANIGYNNHETYFYFCLYIYDSINKKTVYISDDSCRDLPLPISYAMLNPESEDHETHKSTVSLGSMEYSTVKGTTPSAERLEIITNSAEVYKNKAEDQTSADTESTVASIGSLGQWAGTVPNANQLLNYYLELGGDATHYTQLNIQELLNSSTKANTSWVSSINNMLRAGELMAIEGETVNIDQVYETEVQLSNASWLWSSDRDWYLTFIDGFYYTDTDLDNLTVTEVNGEKVYSATITYTVIDYYSFQEYLNDTSNSSFLLWGPTKSELAELHLCGAALDFLIESTITYEVEWTAGERVGTDSLFNSEDVKALGIEEETAKSIEELLK